MIGVKLGLGGECKFVIYGYYKVMFSLYREEKLSTYRR